MSVNIKKHEAAILDAWKKVTDNEDSYDWALFGYEGKTPILKVVSIILLTFQINQKFMYRRRSEVVELKPLPRNLMMERSSMVSFESSIQIQSWSNYF